MPTGDKGVVVGENGARRVHDEPSDDAVRG